ncbi:MAG: hypothetical protein ACO3YY_01935 [Phycisphaerales bacterium]|jgi:hypothetical protein|nr:hypothetical protein [Planctomycetota bacterium]
MKILLRLAVAFVLLLVVGVVVALLSLDSIAKGVVESQGSKALGTSVELDSISIRPVAGRASIAGLSVANPQGYRKPSILVLDRGSIAVRLGSLLSDRPEVPEILIDGVKVDVEQKPGTSNLKELIDGMKAAAVGDDGAVTGEPGTTQRFQVDRLSIKDVSVTAQILPIAGGASEITFEIEEIEIADLDSGDAEGLLMDELVSKVVGAVIAAVVEQLTIKAPGALVDGLGGLVDSLGIPDATMKIGGVAVDLGSGIAEGAGKLIEGAAKGVGDSIGGLGESLEKGLEGAFGGGDDSKSP